MRVFAEAVLELDEDGLTAERGTESGARIIGDRDIPLLLRENRIALARGAATRVEEAGEEEAKEGDPPAVVYDVPLTCVVHAHPRCRFEWSRLMVDLNPTPGALIRDMAPREVMDDHPVELITKVGVGLKFEVAANVLGAQISPEYSSSRTVYFPRIVSSGANFSRGYWDFLALGNRYLHANRELRLLVAAPPG
jgi:hypothetical protein